ncbi:MAG TPA: tyrosine-type recombinase/integrase [Clostridia bacterium]|nr:tyrosine-type recombinase/integrase [Clostridia bacterium]
MTFAVVQDGSQIANGLRRNADDSAAIRTEVQSLADLLGCLETQATSQLPMLRTTAGKISAFLGKSVDEISLDLVHANREGFRPFLEGLRYKEGSVRSYVNYLRMLLQAAEELGWQPFAHLPVEWQSVVNAGKKKKCLTLIKFLAQRKASPEDVRQEDLNCWIEQSVAQGKRFVTAQYQVNTAWRTLIACGYTKNAPFVFLRKKKYGVPLAEFPKPLKQQVEEVLRWKSAKFELDRPKRAKVRQVSAQSIQQSFSSLYGYATKIANFGEIDSLEQLLQKPIVAGYSSWCVNEQQIKGRPLVPQLAAVLAAVSKHPHHKELDLGWFRALLDTIPIEPYEGVKARKARKYLSYDVLASIPSKIHAKRKSEAARGEGHLARLVMEELMIAWLLVFPWRQRNIRECRIAGPEPNLFKAVVEEFSEIDMPEWARQEQAENPKAEFWQVRFSPEETKTEVPFHSVVPRTLIGLLEEYLSVHRPILCKGRGFDTLFIAPMGGMMSTTFVDDLVSDLTIRYGGRRVTPHLFRDIFAFAWLKAHPKDYLTLSKMLWHKHISTTINYYGSRFNGSSATVAMESWLDERSTKEGK